MSSHPAPMDPKTGRTLITLGVLVIIMVALFGIFTLYVTTAHAPVRETAIEPTLDSYTSTAYGYSFSYPHTYSIKEYTPAYVSIGTPTGDDAFAAVAESDVLTAEEDDSSRSFTDFAHRQAELTCDADGPTASIRCPKVSRSLSFTTASGLVGEEFYLTEDTKSVAAGTVAQTERGPYFSFNISASVPSAKYAVLLVRPPSATSPDKILEQVVRSIATSIRISTQGAP